MKQFELSGSPRENVGRQDASALRNAGRIPGVMYGGTEQVHFSVSEIDMNKIMGMSDTLQINLSLGDKTYSSILQEVQRHPVTDKIVHVDFLELVPGKAVKTSLPVRVTGNSEGVKSGGRLAINYRKVRIFGKPEALPNDITVDITNLKIGDMVRVREVSVPGCTLLEAEASAIVAIQATRASIAAEQAEKDAGKGGKKK
ncbi:MAG: 50S ribosomal protein L25 [Bacteroidetes bacterium]|nr:50S ribosomal protein L25 [Bacteroidota bacterium]